MKDDQSLPHDPVPRDNNGVAEKWRRNHEWIVLAGLVALALNLRSPLTTVPPVIGEIRDALHLDAATAGLLTSIPVLCFGLVTPLASLLIARAGLRWALRATLIGASLGLLVRPFTGVYGLFGGTLLIGISLAIGNTASLMIIARNFPRRMNAVTGIYTTALNIGTMLTGALTAPMAGRIGWRGALAAWVGLCVLALMLWQWADWRERAITRAKGAAPIAHVPIITAPPDATEKRALVAILSVVFLIHLLIYYSLTAWLPSYLHLVDAMSLNQAGLVASSFQVIALIGALGGPALARRFPLGAQLVFMGLCWALTPVLMLGFPRAWPLWSITGGIAQGGTFVIVFMLIIRHAASLDDNRRMSTIIQGIGYSLASLGPILTGWLHQTLGGWNWAFGLLSVIALPICASGLAIMKLDARQAKRQTRPL